MDKGEKITSYTISMDSYQSDVVILYSNKLTVDEIQQYLYDTVDNLSKSDDAGESISASALTISVPEERTIYVIFDKNSQVNHVHHECIHTTLFLFSNIQTEHNDTTDEVFAYLSDSLFREIYKAMLTKFKVSKKNFLTLQ